MEEHDDVQPVLDRPLVSRLLVPAVPEIAAVAYDRERQIGAYLPVAQAHQVCGVVAVVVADQNVAQPVTYVVRDAVQHMCEG